VSNYERDGQTITREIWISHHGTSVLRDPGVLALGPAMFPAGGSEFTLDELYTLPTDPAKLAAALRSGIHGAGKDDDSELFIIVGNLLRESPASPALRQALYEVAATEHSSLPPSPGAAGPAHKPLRCYGRQRTALGNNPSGAGSAPTRVKTPPRPPQAATTR
jgi:hypothetical protein